MPLSELRKTAQGQLGIWDLRETEVDLLRLREPSASEKQVIEAFSHPFRRTQWLATRILLHQLHPNEQVTYDENGKPWLSVPNIHISISHTRQFIAILTSKQPCGIDIETIHPKIQRIAHKFLQPQEHEDAEKESAINKLYVYWCAKEAMYKVYGKKNVSLKENIFVEPFEMQNTGSVNVALNHENVKFGRILHYEQLKGIMLAYTIET